MKALAPIVVYFLSGGGMFAVLVLHQFQQLVGRDDIFICFCLGETGASENACKSGRNVGLSFFFVGHGSGFSMTSGHEGIGHRVNLGFGIARPRRILRAFVRNANRSAVSVYSLVYVTGADRKRKNRLLRGGLAKFELWDKSFKLSRVRWQ